MTSSADTHDALASPSTGTRASPSARGTGAVKLAEVIAAEIEADVIARDWPVGEVIGSETELLARYGVSRGILREAVRLVEHKQVATMRRGPGGGLIVAEPDDGPVIDAVAVYVRFADVTLAELFEARKVIEAAATELAGDVLDEQHRAELRRHHALDGDGPAGGDAERGDAHELHRRIGTLTGNPAYELFGSVLTRLTALYVGSLEVSPRSGRQWRRSSEDAHRSVVEALVAGDAALAAHRMRRHLDALEDFLRRRRASQTVISELLGIGADGSTHRKLAEDLARTIFREVARSGWPVGSVLGSESDLIERYDVSRAVLREAVRLLEHHQIARMRRGPGGGLIVTEPGTDAIVDATALYLEYRGIEPQHLYEVRMALELAGVGLATERLDDEGAQRIRDCLEAEQRDRHADLNVVSHDLHLLLTDLAGNRLLALFLRILVQLSARHTPPVRSSRPKEMIAAEVHRTHGALAEAVLAGDVALARSRMQKHLRALLPYYA
jgi:DNA-binding FadR family transcriptional regulator